MNILEPLTWVGVLLLALYGCANLIRRICLRLTRCDRSVAFYWLAVPPHGMAVEPLCRCLQSQTAWKGECTRTLLLLPECTPEETELATRLLAENPSVVPLAEPELITFITTLHTKQEV